jgi:hypothetical protein
MARQDELYQWTRVVTKRLPHLSKPQATVLALWSFGLVLAQACSTTRVAKRLAKRQHGKREAVRQRLREWYCEAEAKHGTQRQSLDVQSCFGPLLAWIVAWWPASEQRLALALDATDLADRFTVLVISVLYRGCAIPVAWHMLPSKQPGSWQPHWARLLQALAPQVPRGWLVLVLSDRGLYSRRLYRVVRRMRWHPFFRINAQGNFRLAHTTDWRPLGSLPGGVDTGWAQHVICFQHQPLGCTLLAYQAAGYKACWLVVTDLPAAQAQIGWYGLRAWIECGFKHFKSHGWQWQRTRMTDPARVARHWLALAVATLWCVSVGGEVDAQQPASSLADLPPTHIARRTQGQRKPRRVFSCFQQGLMAIGDAMLDRKCLPLTRFLPDPWPDLPPALVPRRKHLAGQP